MAVGKDVFSLEIDSSPAPSSAEPQNIPTGVKQTSRTSSFEIENLLKTAEQVNKEFFNYYYSSPISQIVIIIKGQLIRRLRIMLIKNEMK